MRSRKKIAATIPERNRRREKYPEAVVELWGKKSRDLLTDLPLID